MQENIFFLLIFFRDVLYCIAERKNYSEEVCMRYITAVFVLFILLTGCHTQVQIPTVAEFNLNRYLGKWYEVARLPNSFEKEMTDIQAEYSLNPNGTVKVLNSGIRRGERSYITGIARKTSVPGELMVSFFRPFYSSYRVAALAPDYSSALVVSGDSRRYLWILSRTPQINKKVLQDYLNLAAQYGFDTSKIIYSSSNSGFSMGT